MMPHTQDGIILSLLVFLGFYLAYLYGRKTKQFKWDEYIAIIALPTAYIFYQSYYNHTLALFFILSSVSGFVLEYILGITFHKTLNKKLWVYTRFHLHGYTSFLTLPVWGIAGILFWHLSRFVGL